MIMKTALQCLALMALAESAAAFGPISSFLPRHPLLSAATCSIRAQPPAKQGGARAAPLRLGGLRLAVSSAPVTISGTNIELTDALKKYVNDKVGSAIDKVGKKVTGCDVTLKVDKNPSVEKNQEIEIVMSVKGTVLRTKEASHDMYASIDAAADSVKRKLRKYKEKIIDAHRAGKPEASDFDTSEIEAFEEFNTEYDKTYDIPEVDMKVVKKKQFAMSPISTEEAVLCLEYLDHDFYVYKNKENNKVSVVYKRGSGGVGLIEPE